MSGDEDDIIARVRRSTSTRRASGVPGTAHGEDGAIVRLHARIPQTRANGPGLRYGVWFQGCSLACPGCFNPESHSRDAGEVTSVSELVADILAAPEIEGVTISGGEPFQQPAALEQLLAQVRAESLLSTLVFTGFTLAELRSIPDSARILSSVDVLLTGRYRNDMRVASGLKGSANKEFHFLTDRYTASDMPEIPESEILIDAEGNVVVTGISPLRL